MSQSSSRPLLDGALPPESPVHLDPDYELATFAVERRLLTSPQVNLCLLALSEAEAAGEPKSLGQLLVQRKLLSPLQVRALELEFAAGLSSGNESAELMLGQQLLQAKLVDQRLVRACLEEQARLADKAPRLGDLLVSRGALSQQLLDDLVSRRARRMLRCTNCSARFNVRGYNPDAIYRCKHCRGLLSEDIQSSDHDAPSQAYDESALDFDHSSSATLAVPIAGDYAGYEIVERVAEGTMGYVFKARKEGRVVALKVLKEPDDEQSEARVQRFRNEAKASMRIDHPYVIRVYDHGETDGHHWMAMEYIDGASFHDHIDGGRLSLVEGISALIRIAQGLQAAHSAGVVHRDLKPANILIRPSGEPVVTDFGLARDLIDNPRITRAGFAVGTPNYMAPEQVRGDRDAIGPWTDIYALGVIFYQLLAGELPFGAPTTPELFQRINEGKVISPRKKNPRITRRLERICLTAMHLDPAKRFQTAREFAKALIGVLPSGNLQLPGHRDRLRRERRQQRYEELSKEGASLLEQGCLTEARETFRRAVFEAGGDPTDLLEDLADYLDEEVPEHLYGIVRILLDLEEIAGWRPLINAMRCEGAHPLERVLVEIGDDVVLRFLRQVSRSRSQALAAKAARLRRAIYLDREQFLRIWMLPERASDRQRMALVHFVESLRRRDLDPVRRLTQILAATEPDRAELISVILGRQSDHFFAEAMACLNAGQAEPALQRLDLSLLCAPANPIALLVRGEQREAKGDLEGARADYRSVLQLLPDHGDLAEHLGMLEGCAETGVMHAPSLPLGAPPQPE